MTPTNLKIRYTQDPDHGWIHVKRDLAKSVLGPDFIKITPFSYQRGSTIYLDEDQDADLFLQAATLAGCNVTLVVHHANKHSPIRSYRPFTP